MWSGIFVALLFSFLIFTIGDKRSFYIFCCLYILNCKFLIIGPVTVEDIIIVVFMLVLFKDGNLKQKSRGYPFWLCTFLFAFSIVLSTFFSQMTPHYPLSLVLCLRIVCVPFLFFYHIKSKQDVKAVLMIIIGVMTFGLLLSVTAEILNVNLYLNFIRIIMNYEVGWDKLDDIRYGFGRAQGFCVQPVSYGYICMTVVSVFLLLLYNSIKKLNMSRILFIMGIISCIVGCFLSGSRSAILPLFICIVYFYFKKFTSEAYLLVLAIFVFVGYWVYDEYFDNVWNSIFYSNMQGFGSSSEMRFDQLNISLYYLSKSPLVGLGPSAIFEYVQTQMGEAILGGESVWFSLLIDQGIIGCVVYLFVYFSSFLYIKNLKYDAFMFLLLQMLVHTLTSTPGYDTSLILCFVLLAKKIQILSGGKDNIKWSFLN